MFIQESHSGRDGQKTDRMPGMVLSPPAFVSWMKICSGRLTGLGELDVDILAEIIYLEPLLVISQDRTHHVLIAVLFFP